jgi:type I restriction enzyme S subunit
MKLETFFQKFDQFADAPDAIPAMRELLIQLAVRGNLTERMSGESSKAQLALAEAFRIRRAKREEPDAKDVPFPVPDNWGWVAVGDSMDMFNGRAFKPEEWSTEGTPIIRIQNLNNEHSAFNRCKAELDPKIHVHDGDFLISWSGTPGTSFGAFIWNRGFAFLNQHIFRCEVVTGVFEKKFLRLAINARLDEMISQAQGAVGLRHITKGKLESIRLPLPPLAEQKRIVAKVDELMALCDRLALQQQERETRHAALARASLARFADAPTPANLTFLFHPSYAISPADLRKSILTLAVQGKLVPQDPNDEPAGADSESKPLFEIPVNWRWHRLGTLGLCRTGKTPSTSDPTNYGPGFPFIGPGQITLSGRFTAPEKSITPDGLESSTEAKPDDILMVCIGGSIGKAAICREPIGFNQQINSVRLQRDLPEFIYLAVTAGYFQEQVLANASGSATPIINKGKWEQISIPLPPLSEQRRIVAKVSELMALVDALESQLAASRATAENLLAAVVAELTEGTHASPAC